VSARVPFLELTFDLGAIAAQAAEEACFAVGALAVTLTDARDDPVLEPAPGEVRLWPATRAQALFCEQAEPTAARLALAAALAVPPASIAARLVPDRAWERAWLADFHAMRFGERLWVAPHHEPVTEPGAVVVQLDPGLAFGTGTHPTTAMCLEWLERHLEAGARAIDYGCGSGILAIAAAKLGARRIECYDSDPQALCAARENAARNGVADRVIALERAEALALGADVLLSNILAGPLCELAPRFAALVRAQGRVVLAGLLASQVAEVTEACRAWFDVRPFAIRDDWVGLAGARTG